MEDFRNLTGVEHIIVNREVRRVPVVAENEVKTVTTTELIQQPTYKIQQVHIPPHVIITKKQDPHTIFVDRGSSSTSNTIQHFNQTNHLANSVVSSDKGKRKGVELNQKPKKRRYPKKPSNSEEDVDFDIGRAKIDVTPLPPLQENRLTKDISKEYAITDEGVDLDEEKLPFGLSQCKEVVDKIRERKDEEMEYKIVYAPRGTTRSGRQSKPRRMYEEEVEEKREAPRRSSKKASAKNPPKSAIGERLSPLELQVPTDSYSQYLVEQKPSAD